MSRPAAALKFVESSASPAEEPARRRNPRVRMSIPVAVRLQGRAIELSSYDVSMRGMFVLSSETRWQAHELVQLDIGSNPPVRLNGVVTRVVPMPHGKQPAGFGVIFHTSDPMALKRWATFVREHAAGRRGDVP